MSAVPTLSRWGTFVRSLGGHVGLDMGWKERAWAEFSDDKHGTVDVVCQLGEDGDLDVTCRPKLEGDNIREHPRLANALAALAYVNPAPAGDGAAVSRDDHRGDWRQLDDDLAVVVAVSGQVGNVEVGGRGAFLVYKGRLWLPNGVQTPSEATKPLASSESRDNVGATNGDDSRPRVASVTPLRQRPGGTPPGITVTGEARGATDNAPVRPAARKPAERRARIFGDEADELIHQARSGHRRRA